MVAKKTDLINAYLISGADVVVNPMSNHISGLPEMARGNSPTDGGNLILEASEISSLGLEDVVRNKFIRPFVGSGELIGGTLRYCIWIDDQEADAAKLLPGLRELGRASCRGRVCQNVETSG